MAISGQFWFRERCIVSLLISFGVDWKLDFVDSAEKSTSKTPPPLAWKLTSKTHRWRQRPTALCAERVPSDLLHVLSASSPPVKSASAPPFLRQELIAVPSAARSGSSPRRKSAGCFYPSFERPCLAKVLTRFGRELSETGESCGSCLTTR